MRRILFVIALLVFIAVPAYAEEMSPPPAPAEAQKYMPKESSSFGEDLWYVIQRAGADVFPSVLDAGKLCLGVIATAVLCGVLKSNALVEERLIDVAGSVSVGLIVLGAAGAMTQLGTQTISQITEYNKMLLPVMTSALAAEGAMTTAVTLYSATTFINAFLSALISNLLTPMAYLFFCLSIVNGTISEGIINTMKQFIKWLMTWGLKIVLYLFTGYVGITGIISGTVDLSTLKATKLTIAGTIPVVGGILSDASESILVGAQIIKNTAGTYGLIAIVALTIGPFLQIAVQYLLLKMTSGICVAFPCGKVSEVIKDFAAGMGLILAMTGTVCILFLISIVCFMRGVG